MPLNWSDRLRTRTQDIQNAIDVTYNLNLAEDYNIAPNTGVDMSVNIQTALDNITEGETLVLPPGTYTMATPITHTRKVNVSGYGAILNWGTTALVDNAWRFGNLTGTEAQQMRQTFIEGLTLKRTYTTSLTTFGSGIGLLYQGLILSATNRCVIRDVQVEGWSTGILLQGANGTGFSGCSENILIGCRALNCRYSYYLVQTGANAYVNENDFYSCEHQHNTSFDTTELVTVGFGIVACQIIWDAPNTTNPPNNNRFWGCNFEAPAGKPMYRKVIVQGLENGFYHCRWEGHHTTDITIGKPGVATSFMTRNVFFHGSELNTITDSKLVEYVGTSTINNGNQFYTGWASVISGGAGTNSEPAMSFQGGSNATTMLSFRRVSGTTPANGRATIAMDMAAEDPDGKNGYLGFWDKTLTSSAQNWLSMATSTLNSQWDLLVKASLRIGDRIQIYPSGDDILFFPTQVASAGRAVFVGTSTAAVLAAKNGTSTSPSFGVYTSGDALTFAVTSNPSGSPAWQLGKCSWHSSGTERNSLFVDSSGPYNILAAGGLGWGSSDGLSNKYVAFKAPAISTSVTYTLPSADGVAGACLTTNGAGTMSWSQTIPAGVVQQYAGTSAPSGWLMCDGSAVSRTTYATLFSVVATLYGVGDGSTTFNVPDMRDRFARGKSGTVALAATGGTTTYTHAGTAVAAHSTSNGFEAFSSSAITGATSFSHSVTQPNNHTGVEPPYLSLNYIIKT